MGSPALKSDPAWPMPRLEVCGDGKMAVCKQCDSVGKWMVVFMAGRMMLECANCYEVYLVRQ